MNAISTVARPLAAVFAMAALTACATGGNTQGERRANASMSAAPGAMMSGSSGDNMGMMEKQSMCDMYERMKSTRTPEERQAMMNERMQGMSPEMREQHLRMMPEQCK